jgi:hypothetical protein
VLDNGNVHMNGNGSANGAIGLVPPPVAHPAPTVTIAPVPEATPETLIFRAGLLTPDQLGELVQERVSSGRTVEQIVVDRGWADAATVARVLGHEPPVVETAAPVLEMATPVVELAAAPVEVTAPTVEAAAPVVEIATQAAEPTAPAFEVPAPAIETAAPPVAVSEPASLHVVATPVAETATGPAETEATAVEFRVVLRFAGNEVTEIARFATPDEAKGSAHAIAAELAGARDDWPFLGGRYVRPEAVLSVDVDAIVR